MDEYRPYPSNQPTDDSDDETTQNTSGGAGSPSGAGSAFSTLEPLGTMGLSSGAGYSAPSQGVNGADEIEAESAVEPEAPSRRTRERADRPEPNLDHPGGHLTGTVARLNRPRRFGFLRTEDGMEVFFHASALESGPNSFDSLRTGTPVEFDCHQDEGGRGLAATLVTVTGPAPEPAQPREPREGREPRESRQQRQQRGERQERERRGQRDNWRVVVLRERPDQPAHEQLEQLLNERGVKPGNVTLAVLERVGGAECWVAYHTGDDAQNQQGQQGQGRR
jgi:cold shock CspA family protein